MATTRSSAKQPAGGQKSKRQPVASKVVGKVALACLHRPASLLKCSLVPAGGGGRKKAALWISKQQWSQIILRVVLAFFVGSPQLAKLRTDGEHNKDTITSRLENSWIQHPALVKESNENKRVADLYSGCVRPAAWSTIDHHTVVAQLDAVDGSSSTSTQSPVLRRWVSSDGYYYVEFKVLGVLALIAHKYTKKELDDRTNGIRPAARKKSMLDRLQKECRWLEKKAYYVPQVSTS